MNKMRQFVAISTLAAMLQAQASISGNSELRFGESGNGFNYSETHLALNGLWKNLTFWGEFEFSPEPELGKSFNGLRKFSLEYDKGPILLKIGDIYQIWGRGLVLNQFDDQGIDFDNGVRGLSFQYTNDWVEGKLIAGESTIRQGSIIVENFNDRIHNYELDHTVFGGDLSAPFRNMNFGLSYLRTRENHLIPPDSVQLINAMLGSRFEYFGNNFDVYAEYVDNTTTEDYTDSTKHANGGHGLFANVNVFLGRWTLSVDVKRYQFLDVDPNHRSDIVNKYGRRTAFQQPPIGFNEFTSTLQNRLTHPVDFDSEEGFQVELSGPLTESISLAAHYAQASRTHVWSQLNGYAWTKDPTSGIIPSTDKASNPVREMNVNMDAFFLNDKFHMNAGINFVNDVSLLIRNIYTDTTHRLMYEDVRGTSYPLDFDYTFDNGYHLGISTEYQYVTKNYVQEETLHGTTSLDTSISLFYKPDQENRFLAFSIGRSPKWSLTLTFDNISAYQFGTTIKTSTGNELEKLFESIASLQRSWIALDVVYNFTPTQRLSVMYGSLQGGLVCSNGVCREVEAFEDGFKLTLTSLF